MLGVYLSMIDTGSMKNKFEALYNSCNRKAYSIAYSILHDAQLAEDAVMESFLVLAKDMSKLSGKTMEKSQNYLYVIVRNRAVRIYNERKGIEYLEEAEDSFADIQNVETEIEDKDIKRRTFKLIQTLDFKYADVLILKYFYELKNHEIANALGISVNTVNKRIFRAKNRIREIIMKEAGDDGIYKKR